MLLPQDLLVVLKLAALKGDRSRWTFAELGEATGLSASQAHRSFARAVDAELVRPDGSIRPRAILETLLAARHYFPAKLGGPARGMPTGYAAPPLSKVVVQPDEPPPVWPVLDGATRGLALDPIYKTAPEAARQDPAVYELLVLVDALRTGRAREVSFAREELERRLLAAA